MQLSRFPRIRLGHFPTPLEFMPRLTERLGGPRIFVKRDDCAGLGLGGSKVRKLEFNLGEALEQGCDSIVIHGSVQSNHARLAAAAAAKIGLRCTVVLEPRLKDVGEDYLTSGNVLMDRLFGADVRLFSAGTDLNEKTDEIGEEERSAGHRPYIIRGGAPTPAGALGYVSGAMEIMAQADRLGVAFDQVVHASDSGGAQAGFVVGFESLNADIRVTGVGVGRTNTELEQRISYLANKTALRLQMRQKVRRDHILAIDGYAGGGYGKVGPETIEAIRLTAQYEGIVLDPVYTGKAMAGLIGMIRGGELLPEQTVLFIHTGGAPLVFAYRAALLDCGALSDETGRWGFDEAHPKYPVEGCDTKSR